MDIFGLKFLLEQTAQEKQLTILYVSLFVIVIGMLVLDMLAQARWTRSTDVQKKGINPVHVLLLVILVVALVALILLVISSRSN